MATCVLYRDEDMEAITVLDVPGWALSRLKTGDRIAFAVPEPFAGFLSDEEAAHYVPLKRVSIWAERFYRRDQLHLMLFTRDDVSALKLESTELPGQLAVAQDRYRRAFSDGFGAALLRMYR